MSANIIAQESWRPVVGFEGYYDISSIGRVRGLDRVVKRDDRLLTIRGRVLKTHKSNAGRGYLLIGLSRNNKIKMFSLLILNSAFISAIAFIENKHGKPYINHIDCDTLNNCVENLEWCTAKENMRHAWDNGLMVLPPVFAGENHPQAKLKDNDVLEIRRRLSAGDLHRDIAKDYSVSSGTIGFINRGETWTHI